MAESAPAAEPIVSTGAFDWTDRFLLGYPPMDSMHREFVEIVNALLTVEEVQLAARLEALERHAERHFAQEREWMESTGFPATQCHVDEHEAVMQSVRAVRAIVAAGDAAEARRLARALADWFPGHADYMDASLAQWMAKRRMGGVPVVLRRNAAGCG